MWINPETKLPKINQTVLFKTVVLHTKKIKFARYQEDGFREMEAGGGTHDPSNIWGWQPFEDSEERE